MSARLPFVRRLPAASAATAAALALLAGCGQLPGAAGDGSTTRPAALAPAAGDKPMTAQQRNAEDAKQLRESGQAPMLGNAKAAPIATVEDLDCKQLIAPFGLADNATVLSELGLSGAGEIFGQLSGQWMFQFAKQEPAAQQQKKVTQQAKHQVSLQLRTAAMRMNWLPMSAEVMYGRSVLETKIKAGQIEDPDGGKRARALYATAQSLLDETLKAVDAARGPEDATQDYKFEVHVTTDSGQNALALPGGFVLIDPALLAENDPAMRRKARFAMAHEVAHILRRHETRALQARVIDAVSLKGSVGDLARVMRGSQKEPAAILALVVTGKLQFERHFEAQELAADSCGERIVRKMTGSDAQTLAILNTFVASLPKPTATDTLASGAALAQPGAPAARTAANRLPSTGGMALAPAGSTTTTATGATGAASNAANSLSTVGDLVVLVTRPIDRHPTTVARINNFNRLLKKDAAGVAGAPVTRPAPRTPTVPTPATPARTAVTPPATR